MILRLCAFMIFLFVSEVVQANELDESQNSNLINFCKILEPKLTQFSARVESHSKENLPKPNEMGDLIFNYNFFVSNCSKNFFSKDKRNHIINLKKNFGKVCKSADKVREKLAASILANRTYDDKFYDEFVNLIRLVNGGNSKYCPVKVSKKGELEKLIKNYQFYYQQIQKYYSSRDFSLSQKECTTAYVDVSHMPDTDDQGELYWCHAWAVANILSFYQKNKFSPFDIAIQSLANNQYTPGRSSDQEMSRSGNDVYFSLVEVLQSSKGVCEQKSLKVSDENWKQLGQLVSSMLENKDKKLSEFQSSLIFQNAFSQVGQNHIEMIDKLDSLKRVRALFDLQCGVRTNPLVSIDHFASFNFGYNQLEKLFKIDDLLAKKSGAEPSVLSLISAAILKNAPGAHAVTLIGRKFNLQTNQCEYLIRNSWGRKCSSINYTDQVRCVEGTPHFWISREDLLRNTFQANYFLVEEKN